jgi:hypothetical protein
VHPRNRITVTLADIGDPGLSTCSTPAAQGWPLQRTFVARHPGLTDSKYPRGRVTAKLLETALNLARWEARIASGPPTKVKDG